MNPQEPEMEIPVALNVAPLNAPHRYLDYLPLVDRDFQIKNLVLNENPLRTFCRCKEPEYRKLNGGKKCLKFCKIILT